MNDLILGNCSCKLALQISQAYIVHTLLIHIHFSSTLIIPKWGKIQQLCDRHHFVHHTQVIQ
jgi:hypothetical protein